MERVDQRPVLGPDSAGSCDGAKSDFGTEPHDTLRRVIWHEMRRRLWTCRLLSENRKERWIPGPKSSLTHRGGLHPPTEIDQWFQRIQMIPLLPSALLLSSLSLMLSSSLCISFINTSIFTLYTVRRLHYVGNLQYVHEVSHFTFQS